MVFFSKSSRCSKMKKLVGLLYVLIKDRIGGIRAKERGEGWRTKSGEIRLRLVMKSGD